MVYKADIKKGIVISPNTLKETGVKADFDYELSVENNRIILKLLTDEQTKQLDAIDGLYGLLKDDEDIIADILENRVDFTMRDI
jgi:hypothetical protein